MKEFFNRKLNKKGLTLVEMVVSFGILGIVILMVGGFMVTGSNLYTKVNAETNLQEESQMALNQAENIIIDAALGVNYGVTVNGSYRFYDKDPAGTLTNKILYVFNYDSASASVKALLIGFNSTDKTLYYKEVSNITYTEGSDIDISTMSEADPTKISVNDGWDVLALNVSNFTADVEDYHLGKDNRVTLSMTLFKTNDPTATYTAKGTVTLRNTVEINADTISKIFKRVSISIKTIITGVDLTMTSYTVVKNEKYQLYTKVTASQGYPSQEIAWYEVIDDATGNAATGCSVDPTTKELSVGANTTATKLRVYAYASTGVASAEATGTRTVNADDSSKGIYVKDGFEYVYDYALVSIKTVEDFYIQPDRSKPTTVALSNDWNVKSKTLLANVTTAPVFNVNPGNTFYMTGLVTGTGLDSDDTTITWAIDNVSQGVAASISSTGFVEVSKFSKSGSFTIVANPKIQSSNKICYKVNIGNSSITQQSLTLSYNGTMNRGASQTLSLSMNGVPVTTSELSDFKWTKSIKINGSSATVSESNLTLSNAVLSVSDTLAYEYSYVITVRAELKNDDTVFAERQITVPKVSLSIIPSVYYAVRNSNVDYGKIKCVVTGIDDYTLNWSIASRTNPNVYSTATNNNSYISVKTGDEYKNTALIHVSSNEPSTLEYLRVKATISGHTNYYAISKINLKSTGVGFGWSTPQATTVDRGENIKLNVTAQSSDFNISDVEWDVTAKLNGADISTDGITVDENGYLSVGNDYHLTSGTITLTVKPTWAGLTTDAKSITIPGVSFNIQGNAAINRGGENTYTITGGYPYNESTLRWTYTLNGNEASDMDGVTLDATTGKLEVDKSFDSANGTNTITVKATASTSSGQTITETKTVTVNKISISISEKKDNNRKYTVTATVTGFEKASDYKVDWGFVSNPSNNVNMNVSDTSSSKTVCEYTLPDSATSSTTAKIVASVHGFTGVKAEKELKFDLIKFLTKNELDKTNGGGNYKKWETPSGNPYKSFGVFSYGDYNYRVYYYVYSENGINYYRLNYVDYRSYGWHTASDFSRQYWAKYGDDWYKLEVDDWVKQSEGPKYKGYSMGF